VVWFIGSDESDGEHPHVSPAVVKIAQARRWLRMRVFSGFIGAAAYANHVPPQKRRFSRVIKQGLPGRATLA
jgi:hypothetical protein